MFRRDIDIVTHKFENDAAVDDELPHFTPRYNNKGLSPKGTVPFGSYGVGSVTVGVETVTEGSCGTVTTAVCGTGGTLTGNVVVVTVVDGTETAESVVVLTTSNADCEGADLIGGGGFAMTLGE